MMSSIFVLFFFVLMNLMLFISHPIFFSIMLIISSVMVGVMCMKMNLSWFFYLLVLVFLGGVMILIIYMNTLAMNEKFFFYKIFNKPLYIAMFIILTQMIFFKNFYLKVNFSNYMSMSLHEPMNLLSLIFLMLYLLLTLICVVKLVKFEYGPLIKRL